MSVHRNLRVALAAPSLSIVGGQSIQAERLRRLFDDSAEISLVFCPINSPLTSLLAPIAKVPVLRTFVRLLLFCGRWIRTIHSCDVAHIFTPSYFAFWAGPLPGLALSRLLGKPTILHYHSGEASDHLKRWPVSRELLRAFSTVVVVPSAYLVREFEAYGIHAVAISNNLPTVEVAPKTQAEIRPVFLSNRNLEPMYGIDDTLRAFQRIKVNHPEAVLTVAGDGRERKALEVWVQESRVPDIQFIGTLNQTQMNSLYETSTFYLNSSRIDNQPLSIMEAMSRGAVVISSNAGGIPHMIESGENGVLVDVGDYQAMAQAAERLLCDPDMARRISSEAIATARREFSPAAARSRWASLYRRLFDSKMVRKSGSTGPATTSVS